MRKELEVPWYLLDPPEDNEGDYAMNPEIEAWMAENLSARPKLVVRDYPIWNEEHTALEGLFDAYLYFDTVDDAMFFRIKWL